MLDIGWSEMLVIGIVALIVLGPKELPNALRTGAQFMRHARRLAREFQGGLDEIVREAELDEARRTLQSVSRGSIAREIEKTVDPTGEVTRALNAPEAPDGSPAKPSSPSPTPLPASAPAPPPVTDSAPAPAAEPMPADDVRETEKARAG